MLDSTDFSPSHQTRGLWTTCAGRKFLPWPEIFSFSTRRFRVV